MTVTAARRDDVAQSTPARPVPALVTAAIVFAVTGVLDLVAPATLKNDKAHTFSDYFFIALLLPFAWTFAWSVVELRRWHRGTDGRPATRGVTAVAVSAVGFSVAAVASLVTGNDRAIAPVYPISMLVSLVGVVLLAVAWSRARLLPRWVGPALVLGWFFGGPVAMGHGLYLILTVVCLAVAREVHRQP